MFHLIILSPVLVLVPKMRKAHKNSKCFIDFAVTQLYSDMFDLLCIMIYNGIHFFMAPKQTQ